MFVENSQFVKTCNEYWVRTKLHRVPNENQGENNRETTNINTGLLHVLHIFFGRFSSVNFAIILQKTAFAGFHDAKTKKYGMVLKVNLILEWYINHLTLANYIREDYFCEKIFFCMEGFHKMAASILTRYIYKPMDE